MQCHSLEVLTKRLGTRWALEAKGWGGWVRANLEARELVLARALMSYMLFVYIKPLEYVKL